MSLTFGVTVLPDPPYTRMIELMQFAEGQGFEYAWTYDSHILWQDSYATLALAAAQTSKVKRGHFVPKPGICAPPPPAGPPRARGLPPPRAGKRSRWAPSSEPGTFAIHPSRGAPASRRSPAR